MQNYNGYAYLEHYKLLRQFDVTKLLGGAFRMLVQLIRVPFCVELVEHVFKKLNTLVA